jgi:hypothetical protein
MENDEDIQTTVFIVPHERGKWPARVRDSVRLHFCFSTNVRVSRKHFWPPPWSRSTQLLGQNAYFEPLSYKYAL